MIYVAGSGPSSKGHRFAHVVTKKKVHWDFERIVLPRVHWLTEQIQDKAVVWPDYPNKDHWLDYYERFKRGHKWKPSNGLQAIFVAMDLYSPTEITLIGFDNILNQARPTLHDWPAELTCIESLVKISD